MRSVLSELAKTFDLEATTRDLYLRLLLFFALGSCSLIGFVRAVRDRTETLAVRP